MMLTASWACISGLTKVDNFTSKKLTHCFNTYVK